MEQNETREHTTRQTVAERDTAVHHGSGELKVLATPALAAWLENAAMIAVAPFLPAGATTVGVEIALTHSRASPVGARVEATATLVKTDGRRLFFRLLARDGQGEIAQGTHTRCVIDRARFMSRLAPAGK
jgi:predicted thioesterase